MLNSALTGPPPATFQTTLQQEATLSGDGLFTGEKVAVTICPAAENRGIFFQRIDLPQEPVIPAQLSFVHAIPRSTRLANGGASVMMVEHLLSVLYAYGIDNARIAVEGPELPIGDGSAQIFVDLIERAGIRAQEALRRPIFLREPVFWSDGDVHLVALPANECRLSYTLHYPQSSFLRSQYYSFLLDSVSYKQEIAPCRTFSLYEEIVPFLEKGIIRGGGLDKAVVIRGDRLLNPEGVRFPDEMVRHKILDLMGDMALLGAPLCAHIIAIRSGHASHVAFAHKLRAGQGV